MPQGPGRPMWRLSLPRARCLPPVNMRTEEVCIGLVVVILFILLIVSITIYDIYIYYSICFLTYIVYIYICIYIFRCIYFPICLFVIIMTMLMNKIWLLCSLLFFLLWLLSRQFLTYRNGVADTRNGGSYKSCRTGVISPATGLQPSSLHLTVL